MLPSRNPERVGTRMIAHFGAQYPACLCPCCGYTRDVTTASVQLGDSVTGYVFTVGLFHSLLQTGLSRRFPGTAQTCREPFDSLFVLPDQLRRLKFRHTNGLLVTGLLIRA
jgi:hypothetical protein